MVCYLVPGVPMRVSVQLSTKLSSTSAEEADLGSFVPKRWDSSDSPNEGGIRRFTIPAATTETVDLGGLTSVHFIHLRTTRAVKLVLDGEEINIAVLDGMEVGYFVASCDGVEAISIENEGGASATISMMLAGDLA